MENRLELNKRPTYELPGEVLLGQWVRGDDRPSRTPDFEPDLCLNNYQKICIDKKDAYMKQIWIKTDNKDLIDFIKKYEWGNSYNKISTPYIAEWRMRKILLEEFYGVKYGE